MGKKLLLVLGLALSTQVIGGEFRYTPEDVIVDLEVKINGKSVDMRIDECPDPKPYDFTQCPSGYKCNIDPSRGKMLERETAVREYKELLREWAKRNK